MKDTIMGYLEKYREDRYYQAEYSLLDFTEKVCELHGQYKGIYLIYYRAFEWLADKLLYRSKRI